MRRLAPVVAGLVALLASACTEPQVTLGESPPELVLSGAGLKVFREGETRATGHAVRASFRQHEGAIVAERGELKVLAQGAPEGSPPKTLVRARYATGSLKDQVADASGSVELEDAEGTRGATRRAHFDGVSRVATGNDPVRVDGPQDQFTLDAEGGFRLEREQGGRMSFVGPGRSLVTGAAR